MKAAKVKLTSERVKYLCDSESLAVTLGSLSLYFINAFRPKHYVQVFILVLYIP